MLAAGLSRPSWMRHQFRGHKRIATAEMGVGHGGFWWVCYICATPIQRRCHMSGACGIRVVFKIWSGARDLNPGPHGPEPCALPNCASPRRLSQHARQRRAPRRDHRFYWAGTSTLVSVINSVAVASAIRSPFSRLSMNALQ
jgi:hypothetical protein